MLKEIFSDEGGQLSSTRVKSFLAFAVAVLFALIGIFAGKETQTYLSSLVTMFLSLGGVATVSSQAKSAHVKATQARSPAPPTQAPKVEEKKEASDGTIIPPAH